MVATKDQIYDKGGVWIESGIPGTYIQLLPANIDVEAVKYVAGNTQGYAWTNQMMGIFPEQQAYQVKPEFPGGVACAAGLSYGLPLDLRTEQQMQQGQRAFTLGVSSLAGLFFAMPSVFTYGFGQVFTGAGLGAGFDVLGQSLGGQEYRPGQTIIAGVTGGLAYPLAGAGIMSNTTAGAISGGLNIALNNYVYDEKNTVSEAGAIGAFAGFFGVGAERFLASSLGGASRYSGYIGWGVGQAVSGGLPIFFVETNEGVKH
ncbi:TPA: hypothetical protein SAN82_002522 [Pseudomonas putida]|nr:hypothetical protein [Pseudomonas putida]